MSSFPCCPPAMPSAHGDVSEPKAAGPERERPSSGDWCIAATGLNIDVLWSCRGTAKQLVAYHIWD